MGPAAASPSTRTTGGPAPSAGPVYRAGTTLVVWPPLSGGIHKAGTVSTPLICGAPCPAPAPCPPPAACPSPDAGWEPLDAGCEPPPWSFCAVETFLLKSLVAALTVFAAACAAALATLATAPPIPSSMHQPPIAAPI